MSTFLAILAGLIFFIGWCFIIGSKDTIHVVRNRIIGGVIIILSIFLICWILNTYAPNVKIEFNDVLNFILISGLIGSLACSIFFFSQAEKTKGMISLVVLAVVFCGFVFYPSGNGTGEGKDSYGHDWAVAMTVAEKAVKSELKSPSSAEFSSKNETTINVSGNTWTVSGWVEAQNSFGATIRNSYSVKFTFNSSDKYTIEYCNIN